MVGRARGRVALTLHGISTVERERMALELRKEGRSFSEIAEELGYANHTGPLRAVRRALVKTLQQPADELRQLEIERLDLLAQAIVTKVRAGDTEAGHLWLRLSESRRKLLGL